MGFLSKLRQANDTEGIHVKDVCELIIMVVRCADDLKVSRIQRDTLRDESQTKRCFLDSSRTEALHKQVVHGVSSIWMEPLELREGRESHLQWAVVLLNTLKTDGFEFGFAICGELSRKRFW